MKFKFTAVALLVCAALYAWSEVARSPDAEPLAARAPASPTEPELEPSTIEAHVEPLVTSDERFAVVVDWRLGARSTLEVPTPVPAVDIGPAPAHLVVRAVDKDTGAALSAIRVRALSDTRFANERSDGTGGQVFVGMTPGTYDLLVSADGYDSLELPAVFIASGAIVRFDPVQLPPGSGRIVVDVIGERALDGLSVELIGAGRHPCALCSADVENGVHVAVAFPAERKTPCAACGFARDRSLLPITGKPCVEFSNLAREKYVLRLVGAGGEVIGDAREFELACGEAQRVTLDAAHWRMVEVEIADTDGVSLAAEWARRLAALESEVEQDLESFEDLGDDGLPVELLFRCREQRVAEATVTPPTPFGFGRCFSVGGATVCPAGRRGPRATVDHARRPEDTLLPQLRAPYVEPYIVPCEFDARGLVILGPVSASELELTARAGVLNAKATLTQERGTTRVRLQFHIDPRSNGDAREGETYRALESARDH